MKQTDISCNEKQTDSQCNVKQTNSQCNVKQTDSQCNVKQTEMKWNEQTDNSSNTLPSMFHSQAFCITTWQPQPPPLRGHPYPSAVVVPSTSEALSLGIFTSTQNLCNVNQPDNPCNQQCESN